MIRGLALVILACALPASAAPSSRDIAQARAHQARAKALLTKHQTDEAIKELQAAVDLAPGADVLADLAHLYQDQGDDDHARVAYEHMLELEPTGKRADDARAQLAALDARRAEREAEAKTKADADARAKAEAEAKAKADAEAERKRLEEAARVRAEQEDLARHSAEADAIEEQTRKLAEQRQHDREVGEPRGAWERARERDRFARMKGWHEVEIGAGFALASGALFGLAEIEKARIGNGGFATAGDIDSANTRANVFETSAVVLAVPAAIALGFGVTQLVRHRDRGDFRISIGGTGVAMSWDLQ